MERMGSKKREPVSWRVGVPHVTEGLSFESAVQTMMFGTEQQSTPKARM